MVFRSPGHGIKLLTALSVPVSAGAIYVACEFFVNGVEWFGHKLKLGATATGTVLAAFGTALPESAVTFVAVILGKTRRSSRISAWVRRWAGRWCWPRSPMPWWVWPCGCNRCKLQRADAWFGSSIARLARDQSWFLAIFVVKCGLGLVAFAFKPWLGVLFLAAYALYVWRELQATTARRRKRRSSSR